METSVLFPPTRFGRRREVVLVVGLALFLACGCREVTEGTVLAPDETTPADARGPDGPDVTATAPSDLETSVVYTAHRGVSTPWFVPVDASGAGEAVRLGPRRGAGYGLGEGEVSYPEITPDGEHVVVVFYPGATPSSSGTGDSVLFALSLDGSLADAPVRIARADQLRALERTYRPGWAAWVDGLELRAGRLDGTHADAPLVVGTAPAGHEIDNPRWVGKHLTWTQRSTTSGQNRRAFVAAVDDDGASTPVPLETSVGAAEYVGAVLPGERVVVSGPDDRLHVMPVSGGGPAVVVSPPDWIANVVGASADGERLVLQLRVTWSDTRELVSVASDGSDAGSPRTLTPFPTRSLSEVMSRDGTQVAWVGQNETGQWAAFAADAHGLKAGDDPRVSDWQSARLHVTAFDAARGALIGSRTDGSVLRFAMHPGVPSPPTVLATVDNVVNHSIPWPALSTDGAQVIYDANTPEGWRGWVVPLVGGPPTEVPSPWVRNLLTERGILFHEYVRQGALFAATLTGERTPLGPWHDTEIRDAQVVESGDDPVVVYACDTPSPGYFAASVRSSEGAEPVLVMAAADETTPPAVAAGHLLRRSDGTLRSFPLDGSHAQAGIVVAEGTSPPWLADADSGRAVFVVGAEVRSRPVNAADEAALVFEAATGSIRHLSLLPNSDRLVIAVDEQGGSTLYSAAVDGADATSPTLLATDLPGWLMGVAPSEDGGHLFTVHSIAATAVPHPDLLLAASTLPTPTATAYAVAPNGYTLWGLHETFEAGFGADLSRTTTSAGGEHVVLRGPHGLYSARSDGSQAEAPPLLGSAVTPLGDARSPDGTRLLLSEGDAVILARIGEPDSQVALTALAEGGLITGAWADAGRKVVFVRSSGSGAKAQGTLFVVDADAQSATPTALNADLLSIRDFAGVTPAADAVLVQSAHGADHSLFLVSLDPAVGPVEISPIDDTREDFVAFVRSKSTAR